MHRYKSTHIKIVSVACFLPCDNVFLNILPSGATAQQSVEVDGSRAHSLGLRVQGLGLQALAIKGG